MKAQHSIVYYIYLYVAYLVHTTQLICLLAVPGGQSRPELQSASTRTIADHKLGLRARDCCSLSTHSYVERNVLRSPTSLLADIRYPKYSLVQPW